ncbi:MAG: hypothetical protein RLZZ450_508 [Pseudomonadota bacterium]|jgi:hypothetical protein
MRYLIASLLLLSLACSKEPNRWEAAEQRAEQPASNVSATPKVEGSKLNAYFPATGPAGASRIFTAEKAGYVEAKLKKSDGAELALLSISEAAADALAKFANASDAVEGFPLVTVGSNQSSALVANKYQVKVSSKELAAADRKALLATFDLKGLSAL